MTRSRVARIIHECVVIALVVVVTSSRGHSNQPTNRPTNNQGERDTTFLLTHTLLGSTRLSFANRAQNTQQQRRTACTKCSVREKKNKQRQQK